MDINQLVSLQRSYFNSGETLDISFRKKQLLKLKATIKKHENAILKALYEDLGKSSYEAYMCEIGLVYSEISHMLKNINRFSRNKYKNTPLSQFPATSYEKKVPYGNVLIMSPWNYPFLLSLDPLVEAIAAGNTVILKPSAYSPHTSQIVYDIIKECFREEYVSCVQGGRKENETLLDMKFDFIFFTGSQNVGKLVLEKAAKHLTPVILELGGKSPCIVDESANIELAAKRIVFGKFLNCGQTCVAPDYILCDEKVKDRLVGELIKQVKLQYSNNPLENKNYGKIVNEKHFERLEGLIEPNKVVCGGHSNRETLQIEPTILDGVTYEDAVMQEEIFGPILPVLAFKGMKDVINDLQGKEKPLALYLFSENQKTIDEITSRVQYGGGCINDVIVHLATTELGFGGVGESGMGRYHGQIGFDAFSHIKSIMHKQNWLDLPMRYQPYQKKFERLVKMFLK